MVRTAQRSPNSQAKYRHYSEYDYGISRALVEIGDIPAIRGLLDHREPYVRQTAANALGTLKDTAAEAVPDLVRFLRDPSGGVAGQAMIALESIARSNERPKDLLLPFKQEILSAIENGTETVRNFGLRLVPFIEADKARRTQIYSARLSDPEDNIRGFAAQGLEELGSSARSAVPALVDSLSKAKKDDLSRSHLIDALGAIGKAARQATPLLVELSSDENGYVAQHALDALLKVDVDAHKRALYKAQRAQEIGADEDQGPDRSEEVRESNSDVPAVDHNSAGNREKQDALKHLRSMYQAVGALSSNLQVRNRQIEIFIIVSSVLTSGTLWTLISANVPAVASWCGAVLSTVVSGLTLYQHQVGPMKRDREVLSLFHAIGQEIAIIEGNARFNKRQFWGRMKYLEFGYQQVMSPPKKGEPVHVPQ